MEATKASSSAAMCVLSMAAPWKAELAKRVARRRQRGLTRAVSRWARRSTTRPQAAAPRIMPERRASKGRTAEATSGATVAAPRALKPLPSQGMRASPEASSPETTTTRSQRPRAMRSLARAIACVVPAQAALVWRLGPRAPTSWASWALARTSTLKRNLRSKAYASSRLEEVSSGSRSLRRRLSMSSSDFLSSRRRRSSSVAAARADWASAYRVSSATAASSAGNDVA
mmetsp:Transcript_17879/g.56076  ORF Transcript_17879/g.56076 Transcript_17879/m.56076 type:complete len:229 (+) Transcript_17879:804-1490(+)